jgi:hypothetical protein
MEREFLFKRRQFGPQLITVKPAWGGPLKRGHLSREANLVPNRVE